MRRLKKALSLTLAMVLTLAMAVPALATETELQISEEKGTITVDWLLDYDNEADDNIALFVEDEGAIGDLPLVISMLDPNDLTFTATGRTGEYEVDYYLWVRNPEAGNYQESTGSKGGGSSQRPGNMRPENGSYWYKGTVPLRELNGSFANLAKADGIPAGTPMEDLVWFVGDPELDLGYWMAAGTFHGAFRDFTVGRVETVRQGNMTYEATNVVKTETVTVRTENGIEEKTLFVVADTGKSQFTTVCDDPERVFYTSVDIKWDPAAKTFIKENEGDKWSGNVYYTYEPYDSSVDKSMVWAFDQVWMTYETTYDELAAEGCFTASPEQPAGPVVEDIPASGTAKASTQSVEVDGKKVEFQMYALLDANGNGTNYVKLRDLAHVLNGTQAQYAIGYSNEAGITITTGAAYADTGSEMTTPYSGDRAYTGGGQSLQIDGKAVEMTAITLLDDQGGGYNYFKLRDLGKALGFNVGWTAERGVYVETDKPYAG